jgi:hypothetical protein
LRSAVRDDTPGERTEDVRTLKGCKRILLAQALSSDTPPGCAMFDDVNRGSSLRCDPRLPSGIASRCSGALVRFIVIPSPMIHDPT